MPAPTGRPKTVKQARIEGRISAWKEAGAYGFVVFDLDGKQEDAWIHRKFMLEDFDPSVGDKITFQLQEVEGRYQAHKIKPVGFMPPTETSKVRPNGVSTFKNTPFAALALGGSKPSSKPPVLVNEVLDLEAQEPIAEPAAPLNLKDLSIVLRVQREQEGVQLTEEISTLEHKLEEIQTKLFALRAAQTSSLERWALKTQAQIKAALFNRALAFWHATIHYQKDKEAVKEARAKAFATCAAPLLSFEEIRTRLVGADSLTVKAFALLVREIQEAHPSIEHLAFLLDRLALVHKIPVPFQMFISNERVVLVSPIQSIQDPPGLLTSVVWHLAASACRGFRSSCTYGETWGLFSVAFPADFDPQLFMEAVVPDVWAEHERLIELHVEPEIEILHESVPFSEFVGNSASEMTDNFTFCGEHTLLSVAASLGKSPKEVVDLLVQHNIPFHDALPGTAETLRALLGKKPEVIVPEPDPPMLEFKPIERSLPSEVAGKVFEKLIAKGKVGESHTRIDYTYARGLPDNHKGIAKTVVEYLVLEGLLLTKRNEGSRHVSVNPERLVEVKQIIAGDWSRMSEIEGLVK